MFTIAKKWKKRKYSLDKEVEVYIMKYYSAIKKKEILPFEITHIDLEHIMLSKTSQIEKDKYV